MGKFIAVLLACVVAAHAATSACPSYSYWCANGFRVLPSRSVYCYTVPFKSSWCSAETYADILAEFPKTNADGKITDMEGYLNTIREKLTAARGQVKEEMMGKKEGFLADVQSIHDDYIATFTRYYKSACADQQSDFEEKLAAYKKELAEAKEEAGKNFDKAVEKAIERIAAFHEKIVASFKSCLDTRACRVESFNTKMDARAAEMKKCYEDRVKASVNKRIDWITKVLKKIYEGVIEKYTCDMVFEIAAYTNDYNSKVDAAVKAMKINYRCSYKCYFSTGCYGFNRKTFQRSCVQFPTGQRISYKLVGMGAFKVDWNGSKYSCLRTCDPATNCPAFDTKKHTDAIDAEVAKHTKALSEKVEEWKADVAAWKVKALAALNEEITCMYPRSWCGEEPTKAEIGLPREAPRAGQEVDRVQGRGAPRPDRARQRARHQEHRLLEGVLGRVHREDRRPSPEVRREQEQEDRRLQGVPPQPQERPAQAAPEASRLHGRASHVPVQPVLQVLLRPDHQGHPPGRERDLRGAQDQLRRVCQGQGRRRHGQVREALGRVAATARDALYLRFQVHHQGHHPDPQAQLQLELLCPVHQPLPILLLDIV